MAHCTAAWKFSPSKLLSWQKLSSGGMEYMNRGFGLVLCAQKDAKALSGRASNTVKSHSDLLGMFLFSFVDSAWLVTHICVKHLDPAPPFSLDLYLEGCRPKKK